MRIGIFYVYLINAPYVAIIGWLLRVYVLITEILINLIFDLLSGVIVFERECNVCDYQYILLLTT